MNYYAGLDISMKLTSIAITNEKGNIIFEKTCESDPESIAKTLNEAGVKLKKIGIEVGCISFWLIDELKKLGLNAICIEAKQMATIIALKVNKTDRNDARLIADAMRCNLYKEVHHRSKKSIDIGVKMGVRRTLIDIRTKLKNSVRGFLKAYGYRSLGSISHSEFPSRVRFAISQLEDSIKASIEGLLKSYEEVCQNIENAEKELETLCKKDPVINLFQSIPGIGVITALTFIAIIDDPSRFTNPRDIGAYLGLTPNQYSSGDTLRQGKISKCGCSELRTLLVECGIVILTRSKGWTKLRAWGLKIMKKNGIKKAATAVARKLAVIMLKMWQEKKPFIWGDEKKYKEMEKNKRKEIIEIQKKINTGTGVLKKKNNIGVVCTR